LSASVSIVGIVIAVSITGSGDSTDGICILGAIACVAPATAIVEPTASNAPTIGDAAAAANPEPSANPLIADTGAAAIPIVDAAPAPHNAASPAAAAIAVLEAAADIMVPISIRNGMIMGGAN
jgi:hypothetical protein